MSDENRAGDFPRKNLPLSDEALLYYMEPDGQGSFSDRHVLVGDVATHARSVRWKTITGDTTLTADDAGHTLDVSADAVITLPPSSDVDDSWSVEIVPDVSGQHNISLATQGSDTVRGGETVITGDAAVVIRGTEFRVLGEAEAPE